MRRASTIATTFGLAALLAACTEPKFGPKPEKETPAAPPAIHLQGATVNAERKVQVDFTLTLGEQSVALADLATLKPNFTLAELTTDPESGLPAWTSHLLIGSQTLTSNPIGGPGTSPANVLAGQKQPGAESAGVAEALAAGGFRYTFANALPDPYDTSHTYRIGVWLNGAVGTAQTCGTLDFVPAGGTPAPRDVSVDADCQRCHAQVLAHGRRVGVALCLTCHTFQAADPDTVDPAALTGATGATNPNPVDFGRLIHRIHRGKNLPTLYTSSSTAAAPALGTVALPLPFLPGRSVAVDGRKYSIVGYLSNELTFGRVATWNAQGVSRVIPGGVGFPRDYRDCAACHEKAPQGDQAYTAISRRVCAGCHPDVWFQAAPITGDTFHMAHPGGPQADDTLCAECHLATATPTLPRKLYVDNREVHAPLLDAERTSLITATIVSVTGLIPGGKPTVVFTLSDRNGPISPLDPATPPPPTPTPPVPPNDLAPRPSPVPRKLNRLAFILVGPTSPDYLTGNAPLTETVTDTLVADGQGRFTYTFKAVALPAGATGAWTIALESRRQLTCATAAYPAACSPASPFYNPATDTFAWPYTGEPLTEFANNALVDVDALTGTTSSGPALARRKVVSQDKCEVCHKKLLLHGGNRSSIAGCVLCHSPQTTDWNRRPKVAVGGNVFLAGTLDGIEERSVNFKTMIHRIHTGGRNGLAQLDAEPFVIYGFGGIPFIFDEGVFPNDLANCRLCHEGETFMPEQVSTGAAAMVANETATLQHANTADHGLAEVKVLPIADACTSCHDTSAGKNQATAHTVGGVEGCVACHSATASLSNYTLHGLAPAE